jgi:phosphoribosylaminoimidazole-succinocarboxamide synthase
MIGIAMRLLRQGKVKDIYELDNGDILFHFSDRVSAFDVKMATPIPRKGEVLCRFGEFWFGALQTPHHMVKVVDKDKMQVSRLEMMPGKGILLRQLCRALQGPEGPTFRFQACSGVKTAAAHFRSDDKVRGARQADTQGASGLFRHPVWQGL